MTNSDIIAIVAVAVSGVISVATLIASYYTNRSNNRAKLQELAFEKRLESLRETYEVLSKHLTATLDLRFSATMYQAEAVLRGFNLDEMPEKAEILSGKVKAFEKSLDLFNQIYHKNRVFIPKHIDDILSVFRQEQMGGRLLIGPQNTKDEVEKSLAKQLECFDQVLVEIHKFIGFK